MPSMLAFLKLFIIVAVPLCLLVMRRHSALLLWIGMTAGIEILNANVIANVRPLNVVGLLFLPQALRLLPQLYVTKAGKFLLLSMALLMLLGFVYGFVFPWPDTTGIRPLNYRAGGRSIIVLVRMVANLSVAVYIAQQAQNIDNVRKILPYLIVGSSLVAAGVLLEWLIHRDIYLLFVPNASAGYFMSGRFRGFVGEPRMAGQWCAIGILLLLGQPGLPVRRIPLLILHAGGLLLSVSTAGLLVLIVGMILLVLFSNLGRIRTLVIVIALFGLGLFVNVRGVFIDRWSTSVAERLIEEPGALGPAPNLIETVAGRFEVFDASAIRFLGYNPGYLLLGTGPGLISLPASNYVPGVARYIYGDRIDSVPHTGLISTLADSGVVGLVLWLAMVWSCYRALHDISGLKDADNPWTQVRSLFVIFTLLYLIQAREMWYIFLGLGLGASILVMDGVLRDSLPRFSGRG